MLRLGSVKSPEAVGQDTLLEVRDAVMPLLFTPDYFLDDMYTSHKAKHYINGTTVFLIGRTALPSENPNFELDIYERSPEDPIIRRRRVVFMYNWRMIKQSSYDVEFNHHWQFPHGHPKPERGPEDGPRSLWRALRRPHVTAACERALGLTIYSQQQHEYVMELLGECTAATLQMAGETEM